MRPGQNRVPCRQGDILTGVIVRIETYGAFCQLTDFGRLQGLIHISQLANIKVAQVEDVVSMHDKVWVKVIEVLEQDGGRLRIKLSLKDVSQDGSATDLGKQREDLEDMKDTTASNLSSMIGMGVALDPMENRLILKAKSNLGGKEPTFRGGYTLVGDDEGEPEKPAETPKPVQPMRQLPPMGRGRGTTLPAWMTRKTEGPTGQASLSDSDKEKATKSKKRKHEKSHHRKHSKRSKHKKKRRKRYYSDTDDDDSDSKSEDSYTKKKHKKRRERRRSSHSLSSHEERHGSLRRRH